MSSYKVLNNQIYSSGNYSIVPIRMEDRFNIMKWRNEQIYHLRQDKPLTPENQDFYFQNVINKLFNEDQPNQILFSFLENDICIGYGGLVHINWIDQNAEISFIMNTELEKDYFTIYWSTFLQLLEKVAFHELGLHKIFTYSFDIRPILYEVLSKFDYKEEAFLSEHVIIYGEYKNVRIHSKFKQI